MKLTPRQEADAATQAPGYWPNYREPSKLARAIERPLADPNWQNGVLNAYAQTKDTTHAE